jgi:hypothetical protein
LINKNVRLVEILGFEQGGLEVVERLMMGDGRSLARSCAEVAFQDHSRNEWLSHRDKVAVNERGGHQLDGE